MVLVQNPSLLTSLDPKRIAGYSVTIALHAFAFMLLLAPLQAPAPATSKEVTTEVEWKVPEELPPPPPPPEVRQVRTQPTERPQPVQIPQPELIADLPPEPIDAGSIPAVEDAGTPNTFETVGPAIAELMTRVAPPPPYPALAEKRRMQGTVVLMILVGADGSPLEVSIEQSSGSSLLDEAARKFVKARWQFVPAQVGGTAVSAYARVPIRFTLQR
ncbi:energy transducer TonB [Arenimonas sp.]|uniref:energy transducer TonB n=1 Tax=Arenimonas sp. TaxID=1872635 RepID=UPI0039E45AA8